MHDPVRFPDPEKFKPERWLDADSENGPIPVQKVVFGFGRRYEYLECSIPVLTMSFLTRRICPGRHWADNTVRNPAALIFVHTTMNLAILYLRSL